MVEPVSVEFLGFRGNGLSARAARQDAERKAEKALGGSYHPSLLVFRGWVAVVFRTPGGWYYEAKCQDDPAPIASDGPFSSQERAESEARRVLSGDSQKFTNTAGCSPVLMS